MGCVSELTASNKMFQFVPSEVFLWGPVQRRRKYEMLYDIHFLSLCVKVRVEDNEQNKIFDFLGGNLTDFTLIQ